jgi:hypothetical protein
MDEKIEDLSVMVGYLYEYFYRELTSYKHYTFNPSEREIKQIQNFILILHKKHQYNIFSLGINWMIDYFAFQFEYWSKLTTRFDGKIMLNWIVGKKAIERWEGRNKDHWKYFIEEFLSAKKIDKNNLINAFSRPAEGLYLQNRRVEDIERSRFYNTPRGLLNCIEKTTRFSQRSSFCITCNYKIDCKKIK